MPKKDEIQVQIREREDQDAEYNRPAIALPEENEEDSDQDEESSEEEESSDEEEDEDAALLTPALDSQILRTIAAIQTRDPSVYDSSKKFFDKSDLSQAQQELFKKKQAQAKNEGKKYTLKDYEREVLLEHGGYIKEEEEEEPKTHDQEQRDLKNAFLSAAGGVDDEEEDEGLGGGLLEKCVKTKEEEEAEDEAYRKFMLQNIAADEASSKAFKDWNDNYKENPNVTKEDAFLIDYVLNRGWMEKPGDKKQQQLDDVDKDVDEEHLDEIDRFESKYNFRFEEEGGANIVSHSRNIEESVRKKTSKRQKERERKKARKEAAMREKVEEVARARNQKMKEIRERLKEIQEITGNNSVGLDKIDLDGDFDPAKYDEQMSKLFNEEFYEGEQDNVKPTWDDDIDTSLYEDAEDDLMMDADYLPGGEHYQESNKRKRGSEVQQEQAEKKQKAKQLLDDIYSLHFEDVIGGDLPTRYKYRKTEPENFGLTAEEILLADDVELNKYVGLKMMAPYRNPKKHEKDTLVFRKNRKVKYREFRKHFDAKLKEIDPEGASSKRKHYKGDGEKKKLRKRRGKKKKSEAGENAE